MSHTNQNNSKRSTSVLIGVVGLFAGTLAFRQVQFGLSGATTSLTARPIFRPRRLSQAAEGSPWAEFQI